MLFFFLLLSVDFAYWGRTMYMYMTNPGNICNIMQKWPTLWSAMACHGRAAAVFGSIVLRRQRHRPQNWVLVTSWLQFSFIITIPCTRKVDESPSCWARQNLNQNRAEQNNCYVCLSKTKLLLPARLPAWLTAWPHFRVSIAGCLSPRIAPPRIVCGGIKENQMKRKLAKCKLFLPFNVKSFSVHNTFEWFGFLDCGKHTPTLLTSPLPHTLLLCI